jgi:predicted transport protein
MTISVSLNGEIFEQVTYNKEDAFEQLIAQNAQTIFGDKSIYIDIKKKVNTSSLGGTIPDGFLIDVSDSDDPQFYLVEVELQSHDFFNHIFPQITKFFAFYRDSKQRQKLIDAMFTFFREDANLKNIIRELIGSREIYKFLKDTMDNSQKILIVIDEPKAEFKEIMDTYTDTWGRMVKVQIVNHFRRNNSNILTVEPPFQSIPFEDATSLSTELEITESSQYTEEFHLDGCETNVRDVYSKLKEDFLNVKSTLMFNPVKEYVGVRDIRNIAAIRFYKKKLLPEVFLPESEVNRIVHHHKVRLYPKRGPMVEINDTNNWEEIQKLVSRLVEKNQGT